jgi:hypothetical protein
MMEAVHGGSDDGCAEAVQRVAQVRANVVLPTPSTPSTATLRGSCRLRVAIVCAIV